MAEENEIKNTRKLTGKEIEISSRIIKFVEKAMIEEQVLKTFLDTFANSGHYAIVQRLLSIDPRLLDLYNVDIEKYRDITSENFFKKLGDDRFGLRDLINYVELNEGNKRREDAIKLIPFYAGLSVGANFGAIHFLQNEFNGIKNIPELKDTYNFFETVQAADDLRRASFSDYTLKDLSSDLVLAFHLDSYFNERTSRNINSRFKELNLNSEFVSELENHVKTKNIIKLEQIKNNSSNIGDDEKLMLNAALYHVALNRVSMSSQTHPLFMEYALVSDFERESSYFTAVEKHVPICTLHMLNIRIAREDPFVETEEEFLEHICSDDKFYSRFGKEASEPIRVFAEKTRSDYEKLHSGRNKAHRLKITFG